MTTNQNIVLQILENPNRENTFTGSTTARISGNLNLIFDNSFALWKTKIILIHININNEKRYPDKISLKKIDVSKWNTFNHGLLTIATTGESDCELSKLKDGGFKIEVSRGRAMTAIFKNINRTDSIKWYIEVQENDINFSMNLETNLESIEKENKKMEPINESKELKKHKEENVKLLKKITQIHRYNHDVNDDLIRKNRSLSEEIENFQNNENILKNKIIEITNLISDLEKRNGKQMDATLESEIARSKLRDQVVRLLAKEKLLNKKIKENKKERKEEQKRKEEQDRKKEQERKEENTIDNTIEQERMNLEQERKEDNTIEQENTIEIMNLEQERKEEMKGKKKIKVFNNKPRMSRCCCYNFS
jgi:hypothetical protein